MNNQRLNFTSTTTITKQLGIEGSSISVTSPCNTLVKGGNMEFPFGLGSSSADITSASHINMDMGTLSHTGINDPNINVAIPLYGSNNLTASIKSDRLHCFGDNCWGIQTNCSESNVEINSIFCQGQIAYSSWSRPGSPEISHNRIFKCDLLTVNNNSGVSRYGAVRMQPSSGYLAGTTDCINVGSVYITGNAAHSFFDHQTDEGGDGGVMSVTVENIYNNTPASAVYPDYEKVSNNALPTELQFSGGGLNPNTNTQISVRARNILTTQGIISAQGTFYGDNCRTYYKVDNGVSTGQVAIFMPHPNLSGTNSEIIVEGNYKSLAGPCGILAITNGKVIFRNCRFETTVAGKECFQLSDDTVNNTIVFDNCKFINDGVTNAIDTNKGSAIDVTFIDCKTNSTNAVGTNINVNGSITTLSNI